MYTNSITCQEIINSYEKYGDDFMNIDINKCRTSKNTKYLNIYFINEAGVSIPANIKFIKQTITSIKQVNITKVSISPDAVFDAALKIVCETFNKKVNELIDTTSIFSSTKIVTPIHYINKDKAIYWFIIPFTRQSILDGDMVKKFNLLVHNLNGDPINEFNTNNVSQILNRGSIISGILNMSVIASSTSISLNTKFRDEIYVRTKPILKKYFNETEMTQIME